MIVIYKKDEISSFENTIDSRANNLIKDYKEASQERSEDDSDLGYKSGQVIVEFKSNIDKNLKEDVAITATFTFEVLKSFK